MSTAAPLDCSELKNGTEQSKDFIKTLIQKRFDRLVNRTQPRAALAKAEQDFLAELEEQKKQAREESSVK